MQPNHPTITRAVQLGGRSKAALLEELQCNIIAMNEAAEQLFADERFTTAAEPYPVVTVALMVDALGFPEGATSAELIARAAARGLGLCPLELGPHLRLQYRDQPEGDWGQPARQHQAPSGSLTVFSAPLSDDDGFPKGLYLRKIKGLLWLRGYRAGAAHVWSPDDHVLFLQA
jgi:hypothetical protein